jgi:EmrB/QacA subfamily drug resistance transporter
MTSPGSRTRWLALYALCTGMLMIVLDATVVNVALPAIQVALGLRSASLAWVVNAYLIAFGGLLLFAGRLGDLVGQRRVFLGGLTVFTAASLACGSAPGTAFLIVARFVQGAGAALTSAVILGMIVTLFPQRHEQARAIGVYAFVASAGGAVGLLAGGLITEFAGWHWIFYVNVPIGLATLLAAARLLPADRRRPGAGVDVAGAVLVTSALMLGVYTILAPASQLGWSAPRTLVLGAAALALLAGFAARQAAAARPLLPLRVLRSPAIVGANLAQALGSVGMFGSFFLGALYLQHVLGYDPMRIGLAFLPVTTAMGLLSVCCTEWLAARFGSARVVVPGLLLIGAGLTRLALVPAHATLLGGVLPATVLLGTGAGLCFPQLMTLGVSGVAAEDAGVASGLINTSGQVGGALGVAVLATVSSGRAGALRLAGAPEAAALTGGYHAAFWVAAALAGAALLAVLALLRPGFRSAARPVGDALTEG